MQLKTALLSSAVLATLAGLAVYGMHTDTTSAPAAAMAGAQGHAAGSHAVPAASAHALAAAAQNKQALRAMIDTSARPGSYQAWASSSPEQADHTAAAERARELLATAGAREVNLAKADGFAARDVMIDRDGTEHVRMERTYQGLPVVGGDMVVHSRDGQLLSVTQSNNMRTGARPNLTPGISAAQAQTEAGAQFDGRVADVDPAKLVVYARGMEPTLAYEVGLRGARNNSQTPGVMSYYIDAGNGGLLGAEDHFETAAANGTGKSLTLGNVGIVTDSTTTGYQLIDPSRGNGRTLDMLNKSADLTTTDESVTLNGFLVAQVFTDADNVWGNNLKTDRATAAADVDYGVATTWDYYNTVFGRNGLRNDGKGIDAFVHYGSNYFNAGLGTFQNGRMLMIYGDGNWSNSSTPLVALDVAAHEMSHGVNAATANLVYTGDSGGLNEGNSDIFGTLVEFSTNNPNDPGDWLIGEKIYPTPAYSWGAPQALRRQFDQASDYVSINCYPAGGFTTQDSHNTSGVANRFAYLLSEGVVIPTAFASYYYSKSQLVCNTDTTIVGIGKAKLGAIWYRALTKYFVSSTTYPQARAGTLQAAADLYGSGSTEYLTVARAWSAAGVN